jgi:CheY-like chemotaxis protein
VQIVSEPGCGTTVKIKLPRHTAESDQPERAAPEVEAGQGKGTVLIVDDEAEVRTVMSEMLRMHGYLVREAVDARVALHLLFEGTPPDVLVTDIGLPGGMNGRQLADIARTQWPGLPVLLITGYAEGTVMKNEPLPPQMELLTKPFPMSGLLARIAAMSGQGAH